MRSQLGVILERAWATIIISYTPATLTITQAALTVAANNVSKTYGDTHTFDTTTPSTEFFGYGSEEQRQLWIVSR